MKIYFYVLFLLVLPHSAFADCLFNGVANGQNVVKKFDDEKLYVCKGTAWLSVSDAEKITKITVNTARYGWGGVTNDVTQFYKNLCDNKQTCNIQPTNAKHGDPRPGPRKELAIYWACGSLPQQSQSVGEDALSSISCGE